jgi:uncharacterized protein (TIRG00374 family)
VSSQLSMVRKYRQWVVWALVFGVVIYAGASMWADSDKVGDEFGKLNWSLYGGALLLTLGNYALRAGKWHYLIRLLGIDINARDNIRIFTAGLSMTISPGKAGEMLKPYLVSERTGVPMTQTVPALVAERLTDIIAIVILMALSLPSIGSGAEDHTTSLLWICAAIVLGLSVLASERLSLWFIALISKLPVIKRVSHKIEMLYRSTRICLSIIPLLVTILVSLIAWALECIGFVLIFDAMGLAEVSIGQATFIYTAGTVVGGLVAILPGGVGAAEGSMIGLMLKLPIAISEAQALTAAMLIRIATLWMGVLIGAVALLGLDDLLKSVDPDEFKRLDTAEELISASTIKDVDAIPHD